MRFNAKLQGGQKVLGPSIGGVEIEERVGMELDERETRMRWSNADDVTRGTTKNVLVGFV